MQNLSHPKASECSRIFGILCPSTLLRGLIRFSQLDCYNSSNMNITLQGKRFPVTAKWDLRIPWLGKKPTTIYQLEIFHLLFKKVEIHFKKAHASQEAG